MLRAKFGFRYPDAVTPDVSKIQVSYSKRITSVKEEAVTEDLDIVKTFYGKRLNVETDAVEFESYASLLKDIPRGGLVLELLFFEGSGSAVHDTSGNNNNGTIYGACLTEDTLIYTPDGVVAISDIKVVDEVYVYNGGVGVKKVVDKIYSGIKPVYRIRTSNKEIYATANHPFLVAVWNGQEYRKGYNKEKKHPFGYRKNIWSLEWLPLEKLREGMPIVCLHKILSESKTEFSEDFMRLVGCFLGDGNIIHRKNRKDEGIFLALPKPEDKMKYSEILTRLGIKHIVKDKGIYIYSTKLVELFKELDLDGDAHTKHIPKWVWKLPDSHKRALIEGILDADGWKIQQTPSSLAFQIELANETLIRQLRALCNYIGLKISNIYYRKKSARWIKDHMASETEVWGFQIYPNRGRNKQLRIVWDGVKRRLSILLPKEFEFQKITEIEYIGERRVYDISIPEVHNFIAEGMVVHNSWDNLPTGKKVLSFDGIDDYAEVSNSPSLNITDVVTVISWIKLIDYKPQHYIVGKYGPGYMVQIFDNKVEFWIKNSTGTTYTNRYVAGGTVLEVGKFYMVGGQYDGQYLRSIVNGGFEREKDIGATDIGSTTNPLRIGCAPWDVTYGNFLGFIGLVRIYNRALSEDKIKEIYELEKQFFV